MSGIMQGLLASFKSSAVFPIGVVDYYKLDSNANNSTGRGNGTSTNISYTTAGIIGNSATMSGTGYISTGLKTATGAKSFSFWLKTTSTTDSFIFDEGGRASNTISDTIDINLTANKCSYWVFRNSTGNYKRVISTTSINSGNWTHIVCTDDGSSTASNLKMYINGSLDATGTQTGSAGTQTGTASNNAVIGSSIFITALLTGSIDEFGIWNRELTSTEVTTLYNSGNGITY